MALRALAVGVLYALAAFGLDQGPGERIAELSAEARAAQQAGDAARAARAYEQILKLRPGWGQVEFNLGLMLQLQKKYEAAIPRFRSALRRDPSLAPARLFLGISYFNTGHYPEARAALERFLKLRPQDREVRFYLAGAYYALEEYGGAARLYLAQAAMTPERSELYYHLAECYLGLARSAIRRANELPGGQEYLKRLAQEARSQPEGRQVADLEKATRLVLDTAPRDAEGLYREARACLELAQEALARLEALAPDSHLVAQVHAQALEQQGREEEAEVEYRRAAAVGDAAAQIEYARFEAKRNRPERAIALLEQALASDPHNAQGNALLGEILALGNRWEEAAPRLGAALKLQPGQVQTRIYLARALERQGRLGEAVALLEATPADAEGRIHYVLAGYYRAQGRAGEAARALQVFNQRRRGGSR